MDVTIGVVDVRDVESELRGLSEGLHGGEIRSSGLNRVRVGPLDGSVGERSRQWFRISS